MCWGQRMRIQLGLTVEEQALSRHRNSMKTPPLPFRWRAWPTGLLALFTWLAPLSGSAREIPSQEIVELAPFLVPSAPEGDYRRPISVSATRLPAENLVTPVTITVLSEELINDVGTNEFIDAFRYAANISTQPDSLLRPDNGFKMRGFNTGIFLRNGYVKYYYQNLDGVDRIEVVRGPVAALYGRVEPGGIINYITKRPLFGSRHSLKFQTGSWDYHKVQVDSTGPLAGKYLAYRVVASYLNHRHWKDYVANERSFFLGTLTLRPMKNMEVSVDYEFNENKNNGGVRTTLITNVNYLADYEKYQAMARQGEWTKFLNSKNDGQLPYFRYNMEINQRYPYHYTLDDYKASGGNEAGYYNFLSRYMVNPNRWTSRSRNEQGDRLFPTNQDWYQFVASNSWLSPNFSDPRPGQIRLVNPRTGDVQMPMVAYDSAIGEIRDGRVVSGGNIASLNAARQYRYGWRVLDWVESGGMKGNGAYPPAFTGQLYSLGDAFNTNGPGAWHDDKSHVVTGEIRWKLADWIDFRYGANYYHNWTREIQQSIANPDMDGFTLDPGYHFPPDYNTATKGAVGLGFFNERWVHQGDISVKFPLGPLDNTFLFTAEYRDDYFEQWGPRASVQWFKDGGNDAPGTALRDIYYDAPVQTNQWTTPFEPSAIDFASSGNAPIQQGYGVIYRVETLEKRLNLWAGVRQESQDQTGWSSTFVGKQTFADGTERDVYEHIEDDANLRIRFESTTPMYGASFRLGQSGFLNKVVAYASYSETYLPLPLGANASYRDYRNPLTPNPASIDDFPLVIPPAASPPKGLGYEAGLKFDVTIMENPLSGSIGTFHLERTDLLFNNDSLLSQLEAARQDWLRAGLSGLQEFRQLQTNVGSEATEGLEIDLILTPSPNWQILVGFSYLWEKSIQKVDDFTLCGDKTLPPGVVGGPVPHPSLFFQDPVLGYPVPRVLNNDDGQITFIDTAGAIHQVPVDQLKSFPGIVDMERIELDGTETYLPRFGYELANVPDLVFTLWTKYTFTEGTAKGFRCGLGYRYEADSPAYGFSSQINGASFDRPWRNPEMHWVDAMLGYELKLLDGWLDLSLNINNVLNKRFNKGTFGLMDPRSFKLTVEYKF